MEIWVPLFDIFMNSPCPETEASQWLSQSFTSSAGKCISTSTTSFLSLLAKPSDILVGTSSSSQSPQTKRVMWLQTLPNAVQARILSFLAFDRQKFCARELGKLARAVLDENQQLDFWVMKAACQLLDLLSDSSYGWVSCLNLDLEKETVQDEFRSLPDWLANASQSSLPWLQISPR